MSIQGKKAKNNRTFLSKVKDNIAGVLIIAGFTLGFIYMGYTRANNIPTENNLAAAVGFFISLTPVCIGAFLYGIRIRCISNKLSTIIRFLAVFVYLLFIITSLALALGATENLFLRFGM